MRSVRLHMIGWLHAAAAAFQFLTRFPVPFRFEYSDAVFRRSTIFYPLAGAGIGGVLALSGAALAAWLPPVPAAAILTAAWIAVTGALHLDGLMDTADGLLSGRSRERMLEIMKDSRVGAMGAAAGMLQLLLKFAFLTALLERMAGTAASAAAAAAAALACIPLWSRWFMAVAISGWTYARQEGGLGSLYAGVKRRHAAASWLTACVLTGVILWGIGLLYNLPASFRGLTFYTAVFTVLTVLPGWLLARAAARKLGGLTGDVYGALGELLETLLLLAAISVIPFLFQA